MTDPFQRTCLHFLCRLKPRPYRWAINLQGRTNKEKWAEGGTGEEVGETRRPAFDFTQPAQAVGDAALLLLDELDALVPMLGQSWLGVPLDCAQAPLD